MTKQIATEDIWVAPLAEAAAGAGVRRPVFVALPEYRPQLVRRIAEVMGLAFFDFRSECMLPLGWEAARLPLSALTDAVAQRVTAGRGLVLQNAEALLAAKPAEERRAWLADFAHSEWPAPVLVAVAIFQADLPTAGPAPIHKVDPDHVPAETLLARLARQ